MSDSESEAEKERLTGQQKNERQHDRGLDLQARVRNDHHALSPSAERDGKTRRSSRRPERETTATERRERCCSAGTSGFDANKRCA